MKNKFPIGRVITPEPKFVLDLSFHRKLTWKERWQILIGYNLNINLSIKCAHSPGTIDPTMALLTTPAIIDKTHTP